MYAFKVFVSTIVIILMLTMFYIYFKSDKNGKTVSMVLAMVYALSIVAIWG